VERESCKRSGERESCKWRERIVRESVSGERERERVVSGERIQAV